MRLQLLRIFLYEILKNILWTELAIFVQNSKSRKNDEITVKTRLGIFCSDEIDMLFSRNWLFQGGFIWLLFVSGRELKNGIIFPEAPR